MHAQWAAGVAMQEAGWRAQLLVQASAGSADPLELALCHPQLLLRGQGRRLRLAAQLLYLPPPL